MTWPPPPKPLGSPALLGTGLAWVVLPFVLPRFDETQRLGDLFCRLTLYPARGVPPGFLLIPGIALVAAVCRRRWPVDRLLAALGCCAVWLATMFVYADIPSRRCGPSCQSNLKQIGMAALAYAEEHNQTLPSAADWPAKLEPYTKSTQLYACWAQPELPLGYAMNPALDGLRLDEVALPHRTVLFFDAEGGVPEPNRHHGKVNVCLVDGHVRAICLADPDWRRRARPGQAPEVEP